MPPIVIALIGFLGGMAAMTIINLYKWVLNYFNNGFT